MVLNHDSDDMQICVMLQEQSRTYVIAKATHPEPLQSEVALDSMDEEQTWPTAEELGDQKCEGYICECSYS